MTSFGDVTASVTRCTLLDSDGDACGLPGHAGLPLGVCQLHAIAITRAVLKLGHIEIRQESA